MKKNIKILALAALLTIMGPVGQVSAASPEAGGSSTVSYLPGKATGTDPDTGNLADWTVDYPVKVVLNDSNISQTTGQKMTFSLEDTNNLNNPYTGSSTVNLRVKNHNDILSDSYRGRLKMMDSKDSLQTNVVMMIGLAQRYNGNDNIQFKTNTSGEYSQNFGQLNSSNSTCLGYAYLSDKTGAVDGESYHQTVTWNFYSN